MPLLLLHLLLARARGAEGECFYPFYYDLESSELIRVSSSIDAGSFCAARVERLFDPSRDGWHLAAGNYYELEGDNGRIFISVSTEFNLYGWTNASDCTTIIWSNGAQWVSAPDWARSAAFEMAQGLAFETAENFKRDKNYFYPYSYEEGYEESDNDTWRTDGTPSMIGGRPLISKTKGVARPA